MEGKVRFFLHDTFRNDRPEIQASNGVAQLHLKGIGLFDGRPQADGVDAIASHSGLYV